MMGAGLDFKLIKVASGGGFDGLSRPAGQVRSTKCSLSGGQDALPREELQQVLLKQFLRDPTVWWDKRWSKPTPLHPDFKHKHPKVALWSNNWLEPDSQPTRLDTGTKETPEPASTTAQGDGTVATQEGHLDLGKWKKLCEYGPISNAVDALDLLVHRGCHVPNNLFYRVLKRCIKDKDLLLGRRIHALSVKSGYRGDAFLATHLISLYASHGRLEEAKRVFTTVSTPDAYNWATIIFAYARRGEATLAGEAIRLYRGMRESTTVEPGSHVYSAVLKACAVAEDLAAGKEVHAHILASPVKADRFVEAGLVNMYAKCGSLVDARRQFDKLSDKDVVTWTSMIAAYAKQEMAQEALNLFRSMQQEGLTPPDCVTYVCLLQACASVGVGALDEGKQLHAQIEKQGLQEDVVVGGRLLNMYAKCGSLEDARSVFDKLPVRNVLAYNAMVAGYAQHGMGKEAIRLYRNMHQEGLTPDCVTYVCLLQACGSVGVNALSEGKQLHAQIKERGLQTDVVLGGSLVNMYAKCSSLENARSVFDKLAEKNIVACNAMFAGYAQQGMGLAALDLFRRMQEEGQIPPNSVTYICLLQACASLGVGALDEGKRLHAQIKERGLQEDVVLGGSLVNMYAKCGSLEDARWVFDKLPERNTAACNAMLAGYAQQGMGQEALSLYKSMQQQGLTSPDSVTYVCLLQACASVGCEGLDEGKQLHAEIKVRGLQEDMVLGGSLVNMHAKCGSLDDARSVFDQLPVKNLVAWTAMIAGYAQQGMGQEALRLYMTMQQQGLTHVDCVTYVCLLQACAGVGIGALGEGKQLHAHIKERGLQDDVVLGGSLVNMYAKCGSMEDACSVFDNLPQRNIIAWTAMIAGYVQQGLAEESLSLYRSMQQEGLTPPNSVTYVCLLQACASVGAGAFDEGKQLHAQIQEEGLEDDMGLGGILVNMYVKCGGLEDARMVFDKLSGKDVAMWTAMIAGYAQHGMGQEALSLYESMQQEGLSPDSFTYVCLLQACASVAALPLGKQLHAKIQEQGLQLDPGVGAAVVNMYAKCGSMFESQQVFDSLCERSMDAWNALISGYARQGDSQVVFDLLDRMTTEGIHPNGITFLSVLTVCSHVGLVEEGREYFEVMSANYGINATVEHFVCMVDLLGRAGHLDEALQVANTMPFPANDVVWGTLLGACRKWKNVEIGQQAFKGAVSLDEKDAAPYVSMANIYASAEMWEAAKEMQGKRKKLRAWKKPGQSWWTDMGGVMHTFLVGDKMHPESEGIYARLEQLVPKLEEACPPNLQSSLFDMSDEKESRVAWAQQEVG